MRTELALPFLMNMKPRLLTTLALVLTMCWGSAQTANFYVNDGLVLCPPQIPPQVDALSFVNNNLFVINSPFITQPYWTANTLNYTNRGTMTSSNGFTFMKVPSSGRPGPALTFHNTGVINSGTNGNAFGAASGQNFAQTLVSADRLLTPGTFNLGAGTLLSLQGSHVDLTRSAVRMLGFGTASGPITDGLFDGYWGVGSNYFNPYIYFEIPPPLTPWQQITRRDQSADVVRIVLSNYTFYTSSVMRGSNTLTYAVFLHQRDPAITNFVYFPTSPFALSEIVVEWNWSTTNATTGQLEANRIFLTDDFGASTNLYTVVNGTYGGLPTEKPYNYQFTRTPPFGAVTPATPTLTTGVFSDRSLTNEYAAYQALFAPYSTIPGEIYGQDMTNMPGRVEVFANSTLNLERTRISADNFMILRCTNHFLGSPGAQISAPIIEVDLATTNGFLTISNLISPTMARPEGPINLYSARWSEAGTAGGTNNFHVLFVDSDLAPFSRPLTANATLRATNVTICDNLIVRSNLLLTAKNLTIATNALGSPTPFGAIDLIPDALFWSTALPTLERLTNHGVLRTRNAAYYGGARTTEFYNSNYFEPYQVIANYGWMTNQGVTFWSREFINRGVVDAGQGSVLLTATNAVLSDGMLLSAAGDVSLTVSGSTVVSNLVIRAGRTLTISGATLLDDGSANVPVSNVTNKNTWVVGNGFHLLSLPGISSLLATTIRSTAPAYSVVRSTWAGRDYGCTASGYVNNAALGRLRLNGGQDCSFAFAGSGVSNALYVDTLYLDGFAAERDANGDVIALNLASNLCLYYGDVMVRGTSMAEKLNNKNGGRLRWVGNYAGYFCSTNMVFPDGTTNAVNSALAGSCNLDSDNDGLVNCIDPSPVLVPSQLDYRINFVAGSKPTVGLSWYSTAGANNYVWYKGAAGDPSWTILTNFVTGQVNGRVTALRVVAPTVNRLYRVSVEAPLP